MAKIVPSFSPDELEIRKGGGVLLFIGAIFFIPTIAMAVIAFTEAQKQNFEEIIIVTVFGSIFGLVGLCMMFGRAGIVMERSFKTITTWWGLFIPFSRTIHPFEDYNKVTIKKEIRRNKNSTYTVYVGRIVGTEKEINLGEDQNFLKTLQITEAVAKFLKFPLYDWSTDTEIVRQPDELDKTWRDILRQRGVVDEIEELPKDSKIKHRIEQGELVLIIPKPGWGCASIIIVVVGIVFTIVFSSITTLIAEDLPISSGLKLPIACLGLLPLFLAFLFAWKGANVVTEIRVSPQIFQVRKIGKFGISREEIPVDQLEEVRIIGQKFTPEANEDIQKIFGGSHSIYARSDTKVIQFGQGLSRQEIKWILAVIENMIAA